MTLIDCLSSLPTLPVVDCAESMLCCCSAGLSGSKSSVEAGPVARTQMTGLGIPRVVGHVVSIPGFLIMSPGTNWLVRLVVCTNPYLYLSGYNRIGHHNTHSHGLPRGLTDYFHEAHPSNCPVYRTRRLLKKVFVSDSV